MKQYAKYTEVKEKKKKEKYTFKFFRRKTVSP